MLLSGGAAQPRQVNRLCVDRYMHHECPHVRAAHCCSASAAAATAATAATGPIARARVASTFEPSHLPRPGVQRPTRVAAPMWRSSIALLRPLVFAAARSTRGSGAASGRPLSAAAGAEGEAAAGAVKRGRGRPRKDSSKDSENSKGQAAVPDATPKARSKPRQQSKATKAGAADDAGAEVADQTVLLVESPAKAKKIQEFLGDKYKVGRWARLSLWFGLSGWD